MAKRKLLVQAVLSADEVVVAPHVVTLSDGGEVECEPMTHETAATEFVNGCVVYCSSTEALPVLGRATIDVSGAIDAIHKMDIAMRHTGMYADGDAEMRYVVLVPFDGRPATVLR